MAERAENVALPPQVVSEGVSGVPISVPREGDGEAREPTQADGWVLRVGPRHDAGDQGCSPARGLTDGLGQRRLRRAEGVVHISKGEAKVVGDAQEVELSLSAKQREEELVDASPQPAAGGERVDDGPGALWPARV